VLGGCGIELFVFLVAAGGSELWPTRSNEFPRRKHSYNGALGITSESLVYIILKKGSLVHICARFLKGQL